MPKNTSHSRHSFLCLSFLLSVLILPSTNAFGQIAISVSQINSKISANSQGESYVIKSAEDHLLVSSNTGLWLVSKDGTREVKIKSFADEALSIETLGEWFSINTDRGGLWLVSKDGAQANEIIVGSIPSYAIKNLGEMIVFGDSLFIIQGDAIYRSEGFIGENKNCWEIKAKGSQVDKLACIIQSVDDIKKEVDGNVLFFVTSKDTWILSRDGTLVKMVERIDGYINRIKTFGNWIYVGTDHGLRKISRDGSQVNYFEDIPEPIFNFEEAGDLLFVITSEGLWKISRDGSQVNKLESITGNRIFVKAFGEHLFILSDESLWKCAKDGTQGQRVENISGRVFNINKFGEWLFVSTNEGLWIFDKDGTPIGRLEEIKEEIIDIEAVSEYIYIAVRIRFPSFNPYSRLYRIDTKVKIKTKLAPSGWWAKALSYVLPANWLPAQKVEAEACYSYSLEKCDAPYDKSIPEEFSFAKAEGTAVPSNNKFSAAEQFTYEIGLGSNNVHYWVKDKWGNTFEHKEIYRGVPSQYFILALPFILSIGFVLGCFALAPQVGFCHSAIMNPWLRKYFSLGSVPLLVSVFPSLRRYILRRYSASVGKDKEFTEWKTRFVCPGEEFYPEAFGKRLNDERRLLLTGQSGIGKTSFFKYLTAFYASKDKPTLPAKVFPVYISLTNYGGNSLEELIYNQLFAYGKITDRELAPMFLEQGGLLIFLDGVNEVQTVGDRQKLSEFVEKYWTSNYICLSSQQSYAEIENIPKVELKTFSAKKVCEFIRNRAIDKEKAERVIENLTGEDFQLYGIPRDLEFAVEILNGGKDSLPKLRTELYKTVFSSIFAKWKENGRTDAENILCEHAYAMIAERELAFDSVGNPKFKEITADLFEQKFLVRREESYNFRHDLIRSYLASEYFYPRWENLFAELDGKPIDSNWLEMLKFSCENIESSGNVKSLVYEVLERSVRKDLVKNLFEWLKINHPDKCESWEQAFYAKYGELDFKR